MKMSSSLQRSCAGHHISSCGRFGVRRLANNSWAVSSVGSPGRIGGFTNSVLQALAPQRFSSMREAAGVMDLAYRMQAEKTVAADLSWKKTEHGAYTTECLTEGGSPDGWAGLRNHAGVSADKPDGMIITIRKINNAWVVEAWPSVLDGVIGKDGVPERCLKIHYCCFLGQSRSLRGAKQMVAQEMAYPWPS